MNDVKGYHSARGDVNIILYLRLNIGGRKSMDESKQILGKYCGSYARENG